MSYQVKLSGTVTEISRLLTLMNSTDSDRLYAVGCRDSTHFEDALVTYTVDGDGLISISDITRSNIRGVA